MTDFIKGALIQKPVVLDSKEESLKIHKRQTLPFLAYYRIS